MSDNKDNTENTTETAVSAAAGSTAPPAPVETAALAVPVEESGPVNGGGGNFESA